MWSNFHTHSNYCDGKQEIQDYLFRAKQLNIMSLGFSSHAPLPFHKPWSMLKERFSDYLATIRSLKSNQAPLELYAGLEIDYIPDQVSPSDYASSLDYTIGSIHFVDHYADGKAWEIDNSYDVFMYGLQNLFYNNIHEAIKRYYELTREMVTKSNPTIVGHLDKIKMHNQRGHLFSEDDSWYRDEVLQTLKVIREAGSIVEINTRGLYQKKTTETYPSRWIIEILRNQNIPITLSSDAHHPDDLVNSFAETAHLLRSIGFMTLHTLHEGKWKPLQFNESGIQYR